MSGKRALLPVTWFERVVQSDPARSECTREMFDEGID